MTSADSSASKTTCCLPSPTLTTSPSSSNRRSQVRMIHHHNFLLACLVSLAAALAVSGFSSSPAALSHLPLKGSQSQQHDRYTTTGLWVAAQDTDTAAPNPPKLSKQTDKPPKLSKQTGYYGKKKHNKKKGNYKKGKGAQYQSNGSSNKHPTSMHFVAARAFNAQLTKCNSVSELLVAFMEQTSSSPPITAATHLAGANKANSVNFSTCLHRLARFANANSGGNNNFNKNNSKKEEEVDERKQVLADPRFALIVCSMAELASGCDANVSMKEGNDVVEKWKAESNGVVGLSAVAVGDGGSSEMQQADDVLNAIASNMATSTTVATTIDKTALAQSKMSKISSPNSKNAFSSRECSNVCWALAKLRMAPPSSAFSVGRVVGVDIEGAENEGETSDDSRQFATLDEMSLDVLASSLEVRMKLFEEAKNRRLGNGGGEAGGWIPELSRLAGKVLDLIAVQMIQDYAMRNGDGKHGATFNPQEMASVLWAFAKAKRGDATLFDNVGNELMRQTESELQRGGQGPKPQELSNTIWAFATEGIRGDTQVQLVKFMADALDEGDGLFHGLQFKPQELSNTAWALATLHSKRNAGTATEAVEDDGIVRNLRWVAKALIERVDSFKPQELSNSIWAFSTVGFGYDEACGTNSHNDYVHVATNDPVGDKELVFETLEVIAENALPRLDRFKAQELNNMAWGFARLGHRSERAEKLFGGVAKELIRRTWHFKPQDVGTTLWSFATAEYFDQDAFRAGASRLNFRQIRGFKPQEMSNTLWALATAGIAPEHTRAFDITLVPASQRPTKQQVLSDPITECFAAVAGEAMRRPHEFKDQELKDVLWAFSKIGVRHPALFQKIAKHIVGRNGRGFSSFSSQGLGNTLWSFAKQAQLSLEVIDMLGDSVKLVSTGRLAVYETSCLDNGEDVIKRLFVRAAEAGMNLGLDRFTNQDLSNTVWAYSTMGMLHSGFFKQAENSVVSRLRQKRNKLKFNGQEIANILWSFATLNAQPELSTVDAISSYVAAECRGKNGVDEYSIARMFGKRQELANLAWSCAVIGRYPKELMNLLYTGLVGTSNDPEQMNKVFKDDGLQKSSIMTLYYVQVAADVEASDLRLTLPAGFPNGWGEDADHKHATDDENDLIQMSSSMLTLTVSKLQRDVSKTFDKIGFDNILEHVIDTNEIKDEYGIQLPHSPKEFLSIDIANIEKQIGIEVDGPGHFVRLIDNPGKSTAKTNLKNQFDDRGENRVNGPTILKHRLLTHLGWDIIHLPYWEYQELGGDKDKEMDYCQSLIEQSSKW
eukprot:CAMPEP_0172298486 /NCGR_PEP_ID=MMETSP1058-20130122/1119_1 /TAXON_ID=83371 /ORGANISM="Detonula confervacea, Strain CCMP 353" /LENGTH=1283 /DNA_ID=CAMNT_0013007761 /DNA_START=130 /DNA_END=3978 /DNA_ORIENTATION=-